MARFMPGKYPDLSTNAEFLTVGQGLTREQIDALAHLEHEHVENRGHAGPASVERVLHEFICQAMNDCVCMEKKEITAGHAAEERSTAVATLARLRAAGWEVADDGDPYRTAAEVMEQEG